jgi:hypothetical protein
VYPSYLFSILFPLSLYNSNNHSSLCAFVSSWPISSLLALCSYLFHYSFSFCFCFSFSCPFVPLCLRGQYLLFEPYGPNNHSTLHQTKHSAYKIQLYCIFATFFNTKHEYNKTFITIFKTS